MLSGTVGKGCSASRSTGTAPRPVADGRQRTRQAQRGTQLEAARALFAGDLDGAAQVGLAVRGASVTGRGAGLLQPPLAAPAVELGVVPVLAVPLGVCDGPVHRFQRLLVLARRVVGLGQPAEEEDDVQLRARALPGRQRATDQRQRLPARRRSPAWATPSCMAPAASQPSKP